MQVIKKDLEKSQIELTIELTLDEFKPYIAKGVEKVSQEVKIEGFRPGKASYEIVKQKVGEMAILEEASRFAINSTLDEAIGKNTTPERQAIGQPQVNVTKLAPENPFSYKVVLSILPEMTMGEYKGLNIKIAEVKVEDKDIDSALDDLREMRATEAAVSREVKNGDKVMVDINMLLDRVPLEESGGKDLAVMVGKEYFVPGFDKNILGAKKGEEKKFQLEYPKGHHKKNLAGKKVDFEVKIKEVFERNLPEINDELAQMFKMKNVEELKKGIADNIKLDKQKQADSRNEAAMLEKIIDNTKFGDLPEAIVESEARNMMAELEQSVLRQGGKFEDYLSHMQKTKDGLMLEMMPNAVKRVKSALIIRDIAVKEKITPEKKEVEDKIAELKKMYETNAEVSKMLTEPNYYHYLSNILTNEKVIAKLKEWNYANSSDKQKS